MTQFQKLLAFCHNGVGHGKASSFHPICWCVCMYVYVYTCIGLPPGHLGDPPVMYWAPTRTSG